MNNPHHALAPSNFPAWSLCPAFDNDPAERADATEGTNQHAALDALLADDPGPLAELSQDAGEAVTWAADYIRALAGGALILMEQVVSYKAPDAFAPGGMSEVYHGTADAVVIHSPGNLADLIDFKSGADDRDHRPQLAGYALALFSMRARLKTIRAHVLYGRVRRADTWALTQADAAGIVLPILDARRRDSARRNPSACDYCVFCTHRATCPALTGQVEAVARHTPAWEELAPAIHDPAAIADPVRAARALIVARYVSTWADAIRAKATELAKSGAALPGWRLQERRGAREVKDIEAAFGRTRIPAADFLTACKVSLPKLADAVAKARSLPKKQAAAEVETILAGLIEERPPCFSLISIRE